MPASTTGIAEAQYRDLYFFSLYRVLEAGLLALLLFGPIRELIPPPVHPFLAKATSAGYLVAAAVLLYWGLRERALRGQVAVGFVVDVVAATLAIHALPPAASGIALMLVFNVAATALLLPLRYGLAAGGSAWIASVPATTSITKPTKTCQRSARSRRPQYSRAAAATR